MPQDAFTIKYVAKELSSLLVGGKISRITQTDRDTLTLIVYTGKGNVKLDICLSARGCRASITDIDKPVPKVAPGFCMLLRKHLQNALITAVTQPDFERIIVFHFDCTSEFELLKLELHVELMGKYSNAILTKDGIILGALKSTSISENTKRVLFSGAVYLLPEPQDKLSPDDLPALDRAFLYAAGDMAKFISERVKGIAYSTALDIVETYGENLGAKEVYEYTCGGKIAPCVEFKDGSPDDFRVRSASAHKKIYPSILDAQKTYYDYVYEKQTFEDCKKRLIAALSSAEKKLEKRLAVINQKILDCRDAEIIKLKGELITANIYAIQRGMDSFEAVNYYDENCGKIKISLDRTLTPSQNAQKYYKRYAKLKRTLESVTVQQAETQQKLTYLSSISSNIRAAEVISDLRETEEELRNIGLIKEDTSSKNKKKQDAPLPFRTYTVEGFKIVAGHNNIQNDRLLKSISGEDLWLHTQGYHSSHVAVLCGGREVPDGVLLAAAQICAYYSDGRGGTKIPVDYTKRRFVKKPPKSAAGFVIYTDYKTVLVDPDPHTDDTEEV